MAPRRYELNFGPENAGGVPTWTFFVRQDTGAALVAPAIVESPQGNGSYYFEWDWATSPVDTISYLMVLNDIKMHGVESGVVPASPYASGASGITLVDAVADLQNLILEDFDESDLLTPTQARAMLKKANRTVWQHAILTNPEPWEVRSGDLTLAARSALAFVDVSAPGIHKVSYVEVKRGDTYYPVWPLPGQDRWRYDLFTPREVLDYRWYIEAGGLYFTPPNAETLTVRVTHVPVLGDPADGQPLLAGAAPQYCDLVVLKAAILAYAKDEAAAQSWRAEYDEQLGLLKQALPSLQGRESRRVHRASDY